MKVVTVVGARPQFIKAACVSRALRAREGVREVIVHTGQHFDFNMSEVFFHELQIPPPDHRLEIHGGPHGAMTGRMLEAVETVLLEEEPDCVLVYGDTNSTLAGALAAVKLNLPLAHVEAGLRSGNRSMPEEINRVLTDHAADLLLAPTRAAVENLRREGLPESRIRCVGDVMYDAAVFYGAEAEQQSRVLRELGLRSGEYILATIHRAENTDDPVRLNAIFRGLAGAARRIPVVFPVHPRTRVALARLGALEQVPPGLVLVDPVGYLDMVMLEKSARLIATDSGGVQKEAFFHHVPCVTLRDETEWTELVDLGWNRLVSPRDPDGVAASLLSAVGSRGREGSPYGCGRTAAAVVDELLRSFGAESDAPAGAKPSDDAPLPAG